MNTKNKITKKTFIDIKYKASKVNPQKIAEEVLLWVITNVEQFIDSQRKTFKLDLIINSESMPEAMSLQNLYRSVPEDDCFEFVTGIKTKKEYFDLIQETRSVLNKVTKEVHEKMKGMEDHLNSLYKRMIFFYEMVGIYNGEPLIKQLEGGIDILDFEYEAFSVGVKVKAPSVMAISGEDGKMSEVKEGNTKEYTIPEGFSIWIEIAFKDKDLEISFF